MRTSFSLFSGCGGSDSGMVAAGYTSQGGIEYHAPAADIYDLNHPIPVTRANILDIDSIPTVDLLWISPPCPSFSIANTNRGETDNDIKLAIHIAKLAIESRPRSIAIENVRAYASSQSLGIIWAALEGAGYRVSSSIECAANYGAPTTRERLIVRASLDPLRPIVPTHQKPSDQLSLFALPNWIGWYEAIAHRIHELPKSRLTENQIRVLERQNIELPLLVDGAGNDRQSSYTTRARDLPANTLTVSIAKHPIRVLVDLSQSRQGTHFTARSSELLAHTIARRHGENYNSHTKILIERVGYYNEPNTYRSHLPSPTIRSSPSIDDKGSYRVSHNIVDSCEVYAADIQCLAAWQSFPQDYRWGENRGEAGRAIGNAVPPQLAKAVAKSFSYGIR